MTKTRGSHWRVYYDQVLGVVGAYSRGIYGLPEGVASSSGRIYNHRALCTMYMVRQEYSEGPDNIASHYLPLSLTATPMVVHQNLVCAFLDRLIVVYPPLIQGILNPGIPDSLLTVSMSTVKCHLDWPKS